MFYVIPYLALFSLTWGVTLGSKIDYKQNVQELINRVLSRAGKNTFHFTPTLEFIDYAISNGNNVDVFEIDGNESSSEIIFRGSSAVALSAAFGHYLRHYLQCDFHWENSGGYEMSNFPSSPEGLPIPAVKKRVVFLGKYRYYQNTCTASYSFAWRNWTSWEMEIDWMAMSGINMPLAATGQELVWHRLWQHYGVSESGLRDYFTGPAFLAWNRMSNIRGFGGPLPMSWMIDQQKLQINILNRYRELDITPVMPAFNGVVPEEMASIFPSANISRLTPCWNDFPEEYSCNYVLLPTDPLFVDIGRQYLIFQKDLFGDYAMSHLYSADTFNENNPISSDPEYLEAASRAVYESMLAADDEAVWVMQGWLFYYAADFWTDEAISAYLGGVDDKGLVVLDLYAEVRPVWQKIAANNKSYIWCMLHNYGGNRGLYGNASAIVHESLNSRRAEPSLFLGTGLTMEAIDTNPVIYELMTEVAFQGEISDEIDVWTWLQDYAIRRYGLQRQTEKSNHSLKAWRILLDFAYCGNEPVSHASTFAHTVITQKPTFNSTQYTYLAAGPLVSAWFDLYSVKAQHSSSWRYDLIDVGRQVLTNLFYDEYTMLMSAYNRSAVDTFEKISSSMLKLISDWDSLMLTHESYLLGRWISSARSWAHSEEEADLFEYNAKNQVTLWGPNGEIDDYASKNWAGLASGYYYQRWELFLSFALQALQNGIEMDIPAYDSAELGLGEAFCIDTSVTFETEPVGCTVKLSHELQKSYGILYASSENNYTKKQDRSVLGHNLIETSMYTRDIHQLALLCDLDEACAGFTSDGYMKTSATPSFVLVGVDFYVKVPAIN